MPNQTIDDIRVDDGSGDPESILDGTALAARVRLVDASGNAVNPAALATQPVTVVDGGDVAQGAVADAAVTNPALSGSVVALLKGILTRVNLLLTEGEAVVLAAGTASIGNVGIDQTTPGTTNGVQVNAALPAGANAIGKLAANSGVDIGDVDVTSVVPGTGATNLGKAEDAAHASGDVGVMALAVRNDAEAELSGTDLDFTPLAVTSRGLLKAILRNAAGAALLTTTDATGGGGYGPVLQATALTSTEVADAETAVTQYKGNGFNAIPAVGNMLYTGSGMARQRGNVTATLLAPAARTATISSADQTNYNGRGVRVYLNVTVASGTGGLTLTVEVKDSESLGYVTVLTSASFTTTGLRSFVVYPGVGAVANQSASDIIDRTYRVTVTAGDGSSYTYSVSASVML